MTHRNIGLVLARLLKRTRTSVPEVVSFTGATRATVYNWTSGKGVSPAYRAAVNNLLEKLQKKVGPK